MTVKGMASIITVWLNGQCPVSM